MNRSDDQKERGRSDPLTRIHDTYTLYATPKEGGEAEEVMVKHFLSTLAEIALAVAARRIKDQETKQ
jgi:hypothetical protein